VAVGAYHRLKGVAIVLAAWYLIGGANPVFSVNNPSLQSTEDVLLLAFAVLLGFYFGSLPDQDVRGGWFVALVWLLGGNVLRHRSDTHRWEGIVACFLVSVPVVGFLGYYFGLKGFVMGFASTVLPYLSHLYDDLVYYRKLYELSYLSALFYGFLFLFVFTSEDGLAWVLYSLVAELLLEAPVFAARVR